MLQPILSLDERLFFLINRGYTNYYLDWLMPFVSDFGHFQLPLLLFFLLVVARGSGKAVATMFLLLAGLGISDGLGGLVKELIARSRPCQELANINLLVKCGQHYSFPSNHATNLFMLAGLVTARHKNWGFFLFPLAGLVGYSRIYVGAHYPLDVAAGAALGLATGLGLVYGVAKAGQALYRLTLWKRFTRPFARAWEDFDKGRRKLTP